jgi:hypothetical protein
MLKIPKGSGKAGDGRCTWFAWQRHCERPVIDIMCPLCGKSFFLEKGERGEKSYESHGVKSSGLVHPSVVCPFRCGFHSFVFLQDWTFGDLPEIAP